VCGSFNFFSARQAELEFAIITRIIPNSKRNDFLAIMVDGDDPASFWDDPRVTFVVQCIQSTHSKLSPGAKFEKLFRTEATW
jgi:hypothetical protein